MSTLHEDLRIFMIISRSVIRRMSNSSDKLVEQIKTHVYIKFFFFESHAVCEMTWKNVVELDSQHMTI